MAKTVPARVKAALRAVERAGKEPAEVVFDVDGAIRIVLSSPSAVDPKEWEFK